MTENEDKRIAEFLAPGREAIADGGFSRRVMRGLPADGDRLPRRVAWLTRVWTIGGFSLAIALFVAFDGLTLVLDALRDILWQTLQNGVADLDLRTAWVAGIVLLWLGCRKIVSLA